MKIFKVKFMGAIDGWCYEDVMLKMANSDFAHLYEFIEVASEPQFLPRYN